jgi:hypothetical protein
MTSVKEATEENNVKGRGAVDDDIPATDSVTLESWAS